MNKKNKSTCSECARDDFKSERGLAIHTARAHPYIPPPSPVKTVETAPFDEENHTLLNGKYLSLGDVVWLGRKAVITRITKTEGSQHVDVTVRLTKKWWSGTPIS